MSDINEEIEGLIEKEEKLTVPSGKMARFSYEQEAYEEDIAGGTDTYEYGKLNNIPLGNSSVLNVNDSVLDKGLRAQASSITRMMINHFFGRGSYNINRTSEVLTSLLKGFRKHLKRDDNLYSETASYEAGDLCFMVDTESNKRSFLCTATSAITGVPPMNSEDVIDTDNWKEVSISSVNGKVGKAVLTGADIEVSATNTAKISSVLGSIAGAPGGANGLATLDGVGRIPFSQLPESSVEFKGNWNASTNTPELEDGVGTNGDFYIVEVGGTWNGIDFVVNDRIIYSGDTQKWSRLPGGTVNAVNNVSPNGEGNVTLKGSDIELNGDDSTKLDEAIAAKAPVDHASTDTTYGKGNDTKYGHVKLEDDGITSAASDLGVAAGTAATPKAVKGAYDALYAMIQAGAGLPTERGEWILDATAGQSGTFNIKHSGFYYIQMRGGHGGNGGLGGLGSSTQGIGYPSGGLGGAGELKQKTVFLLPGNYSYQVGGNGGNGGNGGGSYLVAGTGGGGGGGGGAGGNSAVYDSNGLILLAFGGAGGGGGGGNGSYASGGPSYPNGGAGGNGGIYPSASGAAGATAPNGVGGTGGTGGTGYSDVRLLAPNMAWKVHGTVDSNNTTTKGNGGSGGIGSGSIVATLKGGNGVAASNSDVITGGCINIWKLI